MRQDTKARDFNLATKKAISERDSINGWPCCVYCGSAAPAPLAWSNAHFIARSQGGLGVVENGLTLCPKCHHAYDQTTRRAELREFFREYLEEKHMDWDEDSLYYEKGM
jgi:5-methylcytosine-specific restriction endonuclease McrA